MSEKQVARMPIQASSVRKGSFVILKNRPCKVIEVKTSKTGKHGHAKANITGVCVITDQKCNDVFPASHNLIAFQLEKADYLVMSVEENTETGAHKISCLTEDNEEVDFYANPRLELCKGGDFAKAYAAEPDKNWAVIVIRAPVAQEGGSEDFVDESIIESFRESKE